MGQEVQNCFFLKTFLRFLICYIPGITFDSSLLPWSTFGYGFFLDLFLYTISLGPSFLNKRGV